MYTIDRNIDLNSNILGKFDSQICPSSDGTGQALEGRIGCYTDILRHKRHANHSIQTYIDGIPSATIGFRLVSVVGIQYMRTCYPKWYLD